MTIARLHDSAPRTAPGRQRVRALSRPQLQTLEAELERERARLERSLGGETNARLAVIVDALGRLEQGSYGRCASCQQRIPYGRLLVMPETMHCIACGPGV